MSKLFTISAAAIAGAVCFAGLAPAVTAQENSKTITWSLAQEPPNWNIWQVGATALSGPVFHNVLEPLVERSADGSPMPLLAESWDISDDGLTYTFHLREAKFHDGSDFDAADVVYSLLKNKESPVSDMRAPLQVVAGVEATDSKTVVVTLSQPSRKLMSELGMRSGIIFPENFHDSADPAIEMIGTGPYVFGEYKPDVSLTLNRFDGYWGDEPYFETINHRFISDETSAVNAMLTGEIDMIMTVQGDGLERVDSVIADGKFKIWEPGPMGINYAFLNPRVEALRDIRVRQAIAHAIDRDSLILGAVGGFGSSICQTIIPASLPWNNNYCPYTYDPEKSRALLKEAGHENLTLDYPYLTVAEFPLVKEIMEALMADVGITLNARPQDLATWLEQVLRNGNYEISSLTGSAKIEAYACGTGREPLGAKDSPVCVEEFDRLVKESDTITDPDEYATAMQDMAAALADSAWVIPIFAKLPPTLVRADLEGFKANRMLMEMDARNLRWAD